ncbi:hypothetical protein AYO44_01495 [Planctomycetaceae bacterium SCGC AG-212-F19]|nr:hypothetical protein AYO44_01495 [Planctomycetaceae bacterium SCGC AG-212-F19]
MPAPPPVRQAASDRSALACLRMILASHGRSVTDAVLQAPAPIAPGGIPVSDLALLAGQFGLEAEIGTFNLAALTELLEAGTYPIVYLNRVHLDDRTIPRKLASRRCVVHAVVPTRLSSGFVWLNDPRSGTLRKVARKKFEAGRRDLSNWCIVCRRAGRG